MAALGPQSPNYTTTRPATDTVVAGALETWFQDCTAAGAFDGTVPTASWFNVITAQLREAVKAASVALDDADDLMVWKAMQAAALAALSAGDGLNITPAGEINHGLTAGTLPVLNFNTADMLNDTIYIYDASGTAMSQTTGYEIVKGVLQSALGVTFDDPTGQIIFTGAQFTSSATPPVAPNPGDHWFNRNDDTIYVRADDGVSQFWVSI